MSINPNICFYCEEEAVTKCDHCKLRICKLHCVSKRLCKDCSLNIIPITINKIDNDTIIQDKIDLANKCVLCDITPAQFTCNICKKKVCKRHLIDSTQWKSAVCNICGQNWLGTDSYSSAKNIKLKQTRKHNKNFH